MGTLFNTGTIDKSIGKRNEEKSSSLPNELATALNELSAGRKSEMAQLMLLIAGTKVIRSLADTKTTIERLVIALEALPTVNSDIDIEAIKKSAEFVGASLKKFISCIVPLEDMPND